MTVSPYQYPTESRRDSLGHFYRRGNCSPAQLSSSRPTTASFLASKRGQDLFFYFLPRQTTGKNGPKSYTFSEKKIWRSSLSVCTQFVFRHRVDRTAIHGKTTRSPEATENIYTLGDRPTKAHSHWPLHFSPPIPLFPTLN